MLLNSCAKWRGSFQKYQNNLLQYAFQPVWCILKWNKRDCFQKTTKKNNLLQYAIELVCILKWNKRDCFQKNNNLLQYAIQLVCILKWNKRDSFEKTSNWWLYAVQLVHIEMKQRGAVFKKQQFITVCYSTCVHIEMKQEGQFSKKSNLLQYAVQLVCILKWNKGQFSKKSIITIYYSAWLFLNEGPSDFSKQVIRVCCLFSYTSKIQCGAILNWTQCATWNKGQFSTKKTIYYSMLFNSVCAYWNETREAVFKKNNLLQYAIQLVCVLKWNKRESFQKNNNLLQYAFQLVCILKWNNRDCFQKNKKKKQFITVCYSTCVHIEMKQEGQFSKKTI